MHAYSSTRLRRDTSVPPPLSASLTSPHLMGSNPRGGSLRLICANIAGEPAMCAKNFPLEVFWRALLDIYAIGVYILKFNISKPEYGSRHCRPFFQKSDPNIMVEPAMCAKNFLV